MGAGSPVPPLVPLIVGLVLTAQDCGDKVRPPKDEIEDVDGYDIKFDDVLGNPGMGIGRVRTDMLIEPGGELVGEKVSGGEV